MQSGAVVATEIKGKGIPATGQEKANDRREIVLAAVWLVHIFFVLRGSRGTGGRALDPGHPQKHGVQRDNQREKRLPRRQRR